MTKKLLLGTESGIQVMEKENGAWAQSAESLDGKWVQKLEIDSSGRMYAGVTKDGVYWADSPSGAWTQGLEGISEVWAFHPTSPARSLPARSRRRCSGAGTGAKAGSS